MNYFLESRWTFLNNDLMRMFMNKETKKFIMSIIHKYKIAKNTDNLFLIYKMENKKWKHIKVLIKEVCNIYDHTKEEYLDFFFSYEHAFNVLIKTLMKEREDLFIDHIYPLCDEMPIKEEWTFKEKKELPDNQFSIEIFHHKLL